MLQSTTARRASIRELRTRTSELIREAENGGIIVIERRGKPVAELRPLPKSPAKFQLPAMSRFWNDFPSIGSDSGKILEEDR